MSISLKVIENSFNMAKWMSLLPDKAVTNAVRSSLKRTRAPLKRESFKRAKQLRNVTNTILNARGRTYSRLNIRGENVERMSLTFTFSHRGIGLRNFQSKKNQNSPTKMARRYRGYGPNTNKLARRKKVRVRVAKRKSVTFKQAWVARGKNNNLLILQRKGGSVVALPPVYMNAVMKKNNAHDPILKAMKPIYLKKLRHDLDFRFKKMRGRLSKKKLKRSV